MSRRSSRRRFDIERVWKTRRRVGTAVVAAVLTAGCVGPSRTASDYQRKAANSAEAAVSAIESALLTVEVARDGRAPAPYVSLQLSESEESVASVETAFGAVQPPGGALDDLRSETLTALGDASDVLEELRIAAYRAELHRLHEIARELEDPLGRLRRLMEIAPT